MGDLIGHSDIQIFALVKEGSTEAFDELYSRYWEKLYNYAFHRVRSKDTAFEMVQDIFVALWSRREVIELHNSLSGYLFASVRFQIINFIRNSKLRGDYHQDYMKFTASSFDNSNEEYIMMRDLQASLERNIDALPERCREITRLSMLHNWSPDKIATTLQISHRTVENQLTLARKQLKSSLGEYVMVGLLAAWLL